MLLTTLLYLGMGILGLILLCFLGVFIWINSLRWFAQKLVVELSGRGWTTLLELTTMGYKKSRCAWALWLLNEEDALTFRVKDGMNLEQLQRASHGFTPITMQYYEFRYKEPSNRRRGKRLRFKLPSLKEVWGEPVHA